MTRSKHFLWVAVLVMVIISKTGAANAQEGPVTIGDVPRPDTFGLMVTAIDVTPQDIISSLELEGCNVRSLGVVKNGKWIIYAPGAPLVVSTNFPKEFAQYTPFFVRCAPESPPETSLKYECGGAFFVIENWDVPPQLPTSGSSGSFQTAEVRVRYSVPENAKNVVVRIAIETSVGRLPPGTVQKVVPDFEIGRYGTMMTNLVSPIAFVSTPSTSASGVSIKGYGVIDGKEHGAIAKVTLFPEALYNRGAPHHSLPREWSYSDYSLPPFKLVEPPIVLGLFTVGSTRWNIDTYNANFCTSKSISE